MEEIIFSRPPNELSCIIGNLFTGLDPPCDLCDLGRTTDLVISGTTHSGNYGRLTIKKDRCVFYGEPEDLDAILNGDCPIGRRCGNGR